MSSCTSQKNIALVLPHLGRRRYVPPPFLFSFMVLPPYLPYLGFFWWDWSYLRFEPVLALPMAIFENLIASPPMVTA
ncbi:unnamed protein product [Prunus armeniaca]|uniref:Uncharacterized protein n=1 Tax=Prunus armeniaca TaxID=36596 RepID=A0A6J5WCS0_PRUAR|nr:unnamed protein product [Prunus armeniaca]